MSTSASLSEIIERELAGFVSLNSGQLAALEEHYRLLLRWNPKINLTTVTKLPEAAIRHYCESLFLAAHLDQGPIVDVGSGAGFPGIPVAIAHSEASVTLVESHKRKAVFLVEASRTLQNVRVMPARAEQLSGAYRWLVSRAVEPADLMKLRIAERYALLAGVDDARALGSEIVPLPWGDRRVLAIGRFTWNGQQGKKHQNEPKPPRLAC